MLVGRWDANNDKSYSGNVNSSESAAGHQRAPLFDWESYSNGGASSSATLWDQQKTDQGPRIQEVTTTLGQTAFLHCRVRYLADRRVSKKMYSRTGDRWRQI